MLAYKMYIVFIQNGEVPQWAFKLNSSNEGFNRLYTEG